MGWPLGIGLVILKFVMISGAADVGEKKTNAELAASWQRQEEAEMMANLATAGPEIRRRIREWLSPRDGLLFVHEGAVFVEPPALHVVPAPAAWRAACGGRGLTLNVAGFIKDITAVAFDERQCHELLAVLGRAMLKLKDPARQPREEKP